MKPKDYMIGDILMAHLDDVENIKDFPVVINGLDENGTLVDGDCEFSWQPLNKEDNDIQYADALFPIPLTPEILEKNGFRLDASEYILRNDNSVVRIRLKNYKRLEIISDEYHFFSSKIYCYLHILQHALRLCGLKELASNFKID